MANAKAGDLITPWVCMMSRLSALFVGREMSRLGFGPGQFFFLAELYREEGISQDELSRRVGVDKSNTSRALTKLEQYGLVRRRSDPHNHRVKNVFLEAKALGIKNEFRKIQNRWNAKLLSGFSKAEKQALLSAVKKMTDNAESFFSLERHPKPVPLEDDRKIA
jgi:DNA-binding MarR family transcriptional regulator